MLAPPQTHPTNTGNYEFRQITAHTETHYHSRNPVVPINIWPTDRKVKTLEDFFKSEWVSKVLTSRLQESEEMTQLFKAIHCVV